MTYATYTRLLNTLTKLHASYIHPVRQEESNGAYRLTNKTMFFNDIDLGNNLHMPIFPYRWIDPKKALGELLWMLDGSKSDRILKTYGVKWWNAFKPLGPIYGAQFFTGDQLYNCIKSLHEDPFGRRHVISLWQADYLDKMCIPPCYHSMQFIVDKRKFRFDKLNLSLIVTQRSADVFLGLPYDILVMQLFLRLMALCLNFNPDTLYFNIADAHLYVEHKGKALEVIESAKRSRKFMHRITLEEPLENEIEVLQSLRFEVPLKVYRFLTETLPYFVPESVFNFRSYTKYEDMIPKITGKCFV